MGIRESYKQGTFCWVDLATEDADAAKAFYSELFGWEIRDVPAGEAGVYSMALIDDLPVAALFRMGDEQRAQSVPSHWQSYIAVDDVQVVAARVVASGGQLMVSPFDVMDAGVMAVIVDATGAVVSLWQAKTHFGAVRGKRRELSVLE